MKYLKISDLDEFINGLNTRKLLCKIGNQGYVAWYLFWVLVNLSDYKGRIFFNEHLDKRPMSIPMMSAISKIEVKEVRNCLRHLINTRFIVKTGRLYSIAGNKTKFTLGKSYDNQPQSFRQDVQDTVDCIYERSTR